MVMIVSNGVLEITVGHWPFSDQFYHLVNQNPFWLAKFPVHFQWDRTYKISYLQKTANQFLILISSTANVVLIHCKDVPFGRKIHY